jgi:galactokinase
MGVWVALAPREDRKIRLHAIDLNDSVELNIDDLRLNHQHEWVNYVSGVIYAIRKKGYKVDGVDACITGNVPMEAGLGSSAALEIACTRALQSVNKLNIEPVEAAYIGKTAENEFVGVQSGIMDQFVSSIGEHGKALLIDCRTNEHSFIDLPNDYAIAIVNTMKRRELTGSEYNERRSQCLEAVKIFQNHDPRITALRDVTPDLLLEYWWELPVLSRMRARHVVTENERVLNSVEYLKKGDIEGFGDLMYDSHESLRYDYEVSCMELDVLVDITLEMKGVAGARMTGAGFGGCTVNLVEKSYLDTFIDAIKEQYFKYTAKRAEVYLT